MKLITGSKGFLGSAIKRSLEDKTEETIFFTRKDFDLANGYEAPTVEGVDTIIHCADYYPGLQHTFEHPREVYEKNVRIFNNLFNLARKNRIKKVITIGTTGCYPITDELLREDMLATENPERTNSKLIGYTLSRFTLLDIARLNHAEFGIEHNHLILPNLYGPGDRFEIGKSHLLSSWIRDFTAAKERGDKIIQLWGSPNAQREFMYIDDSANFVLALSGQKLHREIINVGNSLVPTYEQLARKTLEAIDYDSLDRLEWDISKKNTRMREAMDLRELNKYAHILPLTTEFSEGVRRSVEDYRQRRNK